MLCAGEALLPGESLEEESRHRLLFFAALVWALLRVRCVDRGGRLVLHGGFFARLGGLALLRAVAALRARGGLHVSRREHVVRVVARGLLAVLRASCSAVLVENAADLGLRLFYGVRLLYLGLRLGDGRLRLLASLKRHVQRRRF